MDAIAVLKADHNKLKRLLTALDSTTPKSGGRRESLLKEIENEIRTHSRVEEEIFYVAYKKAARKSDQHLYYESLEKHHLVDSVLPEVRSALADSQTFDARVKVLRDLIDQHVEEEETEMFPMARKLLGDVQLRQLGRQIRDRKIELESGVLVRAGRSTRVVGW
jgi:hemerythrin-like domain-containing protein